MAKRRQTASVGLYNELIAQAKFAQDPNKIVINFECVKVDES